MRSIKSSSTLAFITSDDLIDLIDKRYNKNKKHSILSMELFKELTEKSGLPINKRSMKFKNIIRAGASGVSSANDAIRGSGFNNVTRCHGTNVCPCNPDELMNDLELICGSLEAGNNNQQLKNHGINIIDELLKMGQILPEKHLLVWLNMGDIQITCG